ncbi:MAG: electron transport complex subunit RsxE [Treponema sp.]|nr:electron transport complex subunit RsxE [Treponema sp.]
MKLYALLRRGVVDQNPVFVQLLALCPLLAVTTSAANAVTMGLSTTAVMMGACLIISIFRKFFLNEIRIAAFVVIVASFVTILQFMLEVYAPPGINEALGIYIPLIVVNCILFARIEGFASKNKVLPSLVDAFGMGVGFTLGLTTVGIIREFFGAGSIFGFEILTDSNSLVLTMIMAPGAFFTLGAIVMARKFIVERRKRGE